MENQFGYSGDRAVINRIRDIRRQKGLTLADLAAACEPPTTPQTVGRLETGMRNLSLKWMERIAAALGVEPEMLVRSESGDHPQVVATLEQAGPEARATPRDAILATDLGGGGSLIVLDIAFPHGEYRPGDQLWLRRIVPSTATCWCPARVGASRSGG